jgi:hypothetical protein
MKLDGYIPLRLTDARVLHTKKSWTVLWTVLLTFSTIWTRWKNESYLSLLDGIVFKNTVRGKLIFALL